MVSHVKFVSQFVGICNKDWRRKFNRTGVYKRLSEGNLESHARTVITRLDFLLHLNQEGLYEPMLSSIVLLLAANSNLLGLDFGEYTSDPWYLDFTEKSPNIFWQGLNLFR